MTFLTSLELSGFKSFATKTTLGFEPGITGVVGPNGSGKSNIADAIRWVLGAQSKKAVRGKVSTDVIFSGSGAKAAMGLAEVTLIFDNSAKRLPYDYDEVVVTRRLYRSGDSEYLVNGAKVRLTDLQHAFAVAGIGAENYTVIGQGMVDRVLSQSARERRSLFEEAAGVRQFQIKRDEASRKLSETTTNLSRVADIVGELEPRLKLLRRQAGALAKKEEIEKDLRDAYRARYGHRYRELAAELGTVKAKQAEINKEFLAIGAELKELTASVEQQRRSRQGLRLTELLAKRDERRDDRERLRAEISGAETAGEIAAANLKRLDEQKQQLRERLADLQEQTAPAAPAADAALAKELAHAEAEYAAIDERYRAERQSLSGSGGQQAVLDQLTAVEQAVAEGQPQPVITKLLAKLRRIITGSADGAEATVHEILAERDKAAKRLNDAKLRHARLAEAAKLLKAQQLRHDREVSAIEEQLRRLETTEADNRKMTTQTAEKAAAAIKELKALDAELQELEPAIAAERQSTLTEGGELEKAEQTLRQKQQAHDAYREELSGYNVELAKLETRLDDLTTEARAKLGAAFPPAEGEELPSAQTGAEQAIARLERRQLELGAIDPEVSQEHREVEERFEFLSSQSTDLETAKADLEKLIRQLEHKSQSLFRESFTKIDQEFGKYFAKLFGGGKAELVLIESNDEEADEDAPPEFGIDIKAVPPGKRMQNLTMLSGGERALTSVALLFAILTVNPSPFVMLDEVDAALDEANTARFAETLQELAKQTQFVVVTHNRDTMKAAETLYGVTMDETGISTMLSIKLPEAEKVAQAA